MKCFILILFYSLINPGMQNKITQKTLHHVIGTKQKHKFLYNKIKNELYCLNTFLLARSKRSLSNVLSDKEDIFGANIIPA